MSQDIYDAVVIGGGPGGSTAAAYLARAGKKTVLLEKEIFPRFHIGESLLPYNMRIFEELGLTSALETAGFPRKFGAQFELGDGSRCVGFVFRNGRFTKETQAFQVERSVFDHILLKNSRSLGVEVREGWTVRRTQTNGSGVSVEATDPEGKPLVLTASHLVDASGRGNLTGNQEGLRVMHPALKKLALFGHYYDVELDEGERRGDTVITRLSNKWFWFIPVSPVKTSVGCVMDAEEDGRWKGSPEELFQSLVESSPPAKRRMKNARNTEPLRTTADFSYHNRRLAGERMLRVGDAAGFLDPIFSSGVYMAMLSGKLGAEAILESMRRGGAAGPLKRYEKKFFGGLKFYWEMIEGFYTTPFMEVFLSPREKWDLPAAVNAALAGELHGNWTLRWRMRVFFLLVKLQGRRPFLPRIRFPSPQSMRSLPLLLALLCLCGCYSHRPYSWPPYDLSKPGWRVWNGQAVWQPRKSIPELTGDVVVAVNTNGRALVQFSKTLPFATARLDGRRWQIDFPGGNRLYSGHYPLPSHFAWLQLPAVAEGLPLSGRWIETGNLDQWRIVNPGAGETLRGYLNPQ